VRRLLRILTRGRRQVVAPPSVIARVESARDVLGPAISKHDLRQAALSRVGPRLGWRFRRYVDWVRRQGYDFGACEDLRPGSGIPRIYLRYDVHVRDLFCAVALASLHEELQIPGSFQICWRHSAAEAEVPDLFLKLQQFDDRFVGFGLHCSPESSWMIAEWFEGRSAGLDDFVFSGRALDMMVEWLAAFERDGYDAPVLKHADSRAEACFHKIVTSYRSHFGPTTTVSGHGTPLAAAYLTAVGKDPQLGALGSYFHPVEFLTPERIQNHGLRHEITRLENLGLSIPPIVFENPIGEMASRYRQCFLQGVGFVTLFHPATWGTDHFDTFLDTVTAPGWPDDSGDRRETGIVENQRSPANDRYKAVI
jgi:hypothetical protein